MAYLDEIGRLFLFLCLHTMKEKAGDTYERLLIPEIKEERIVKGGRKLKRLTKKQ